MSIYFYYNQEMYNEYHNSVSLYSPHSYMFPCHHEAVPHLCLAKLYKSLNCSC